MKRIWWCTLMGLLWAGVAAAQVANPCAPAANAFLQHPDAHALAALAHEEDGACWQILGSGPGGTRLLHLVRVGDQEAAAYLAAHLPQSDDVRRPPAVEALGQFADRRMGRFLGMVRQGQLSEELAIRILVTVPARLANDPRGQLSLLRTRRQRLGLRAGTTHAPIQTNALRALDETIAALRAQPPPR